MSDVAGGGETQAVAERYARRQVGDRYSMLRPEVWRGVHERQRAMLRLFRKEYGAGGLTDLKLLEVGCGSGGNLLDFIRFGFAPQNLIGNELLPERAAAARNSLPVGVRVLEGDASALDIAPFSQDVVFQSVVFSSILDDAFQARLATRMWSWVKPGGGVLWYDFVYNNPNNPDVRGVPVRRVRELFPDGRFHVQSITLAPPVARRVCRIYPGLYTVFNWPLLRTHVLCWIKKDA